MFTEILYHSKVCVCIIVHHCPMMQWTHFDWLFEVERHFVQLPSSDVFNVMIVIADRWSFISIQNWCSQVPKYTCFPPTCLCRISLNTLTLNVKSDKVYTRHGVPISVTGIAQVSCVWVGSVPNFHTFKKKKKTTETLSMVYWSSYFGLN